VAYAGFFWGWVYTRKFFLGGSGEAQQSQLRIEDRENGNLGAVASLSGVPLDLQMNETRILISLLWMYIPRNWEFGLALSKVRNFGEGGGALNPQPPSYATVPNDPTFLSNTEST
jgi:hypothetical protein